MEVSFQIDDELVTNEVKDFVTIQKEAAKLYAVKNHDYGNSFDKGMSEIGNAYGVGRLYDKMNRLINLTKKGITSVVINESIEDTLLDLSCYAIMYLSYLKRNKK